MVTISSLWLPILLSGVFVFILSSIIHMVFKYHNNDFGKLPSEDRILESLRGFDIPPGEYVLPCASDMKTMGTPEFIEKCTKGPVAFMTFKKPGPPTMTGSLIMWFIYSLVIAVFAAYLTGRTLAPGAEYLAVFRIAGATSFFCYAVAGWQNSIWYKRRWSTTVKHSIDGLIYALVSAGTFAWLWPTGL
jgi:hypothetical protein